MNELFPAERIYPPGFTYEEEFVSPDEETMLLDEIGRIELHNFTFRGFTANRKVAAFGYDYSFDNSKIKAGKEIPGGFDFIIEKVGLHTGIPAAAFRELLLTEYPPGAVINWHRDAPPFDIIAGISLAGDCTFRLRPHDKIKQGCPSVISFPVKRRSLYVIQGTARTEWQHSIAAVKRTRFSITLRTLR